MSFSAIVQKELADLVRERRFGAWALTFLAFWLLFLFFYLQQTSGAAAYARQSSPESVVSLGEPAYFFYGISFAVLALFLLSDGITKEREAGMLAVVAAKPIVRWHLLLAKALAGLGVYVATFLVSLLPLLLLVAAMGLPVLEMMALLYLVPFLALFVFLLGLGLLLGVTASSSKVAIGTAAGLYIPLFFLMSDGPAQLLYQSYPSLQRIAAYTPFEAAHAASTVLVHGGQMPWGPLATTFGAGLAFAAAAFVVFTRQEAV